MFLIRPAVLLGKKIFTKSKNTINFTSANQGSHFMEIDGAESMCPNYRNSLYCLIFIVIKATILFKWALEADDIFRLLYCNRLNIAYF